MRAAGARETTTTPQENTMGQELITLDKIILLDQESDQAAQAAKDAEDRRNGAVLLGVESGITQARIAAALALTPGRVSQIVAAAREKRDRQGSLGEAA